MPRRLGTARRVAAYGIAIATNKTSQTTCASPMTIAAIVGETHPEMVRAITILEHGGQLKVGKRDDGHIDKRLILRRDKMPDHELTIFGASKTWYKSTEGREFIEARGRLRDRIFADRSLSPGDKLIGFAVTAVMDVRGCVRNVTVEHIGGLVGIKQAQTRKSINKLATAGYFEKISETGKPLLLMANLDASARNVGDPATNPATKSATNPATDSATSDSKNVDKTCINLDPYRNLGDSGDLGNIRPKRPPADSVPLSSGRLSRFAALYVLLDQLGHDGEMTIAV